jgi:hypothetical protein
MISRCCQSCNEDGAFVARVGLSPEPAAGTAIGNAATLQRDASCAGSGAWDAPSTFL